MPQTHEDPSPEGRTSIKTILVVEDDEAIGEVIALALSGANPCYYPLVVADAQEALRVTASMKVDLLVIDYHIVGMNGIELYDQLQSKEEWQDVPTLILSASLEKHTQELRERQLVAHHSRIQPMNSLEKRSATAELN